MGEKIDEARLRELLPGTWNVAATNLPTWRDLDRRDATVTYSVLGVKPLEIAEDAVYASAEGGRRHVTGRSALRGDAFVRRGRGRERFARGRWRVSAMSADEAIAIVHVERSVGVPDRVDVLLREGVAEPELRRRIANDAEAFGLTAEQFGSLTWQPLSHRTPN